MKRVGTYAQVKAACIVTGIAIMSAAGGPRQRGEPPPEPQWIDADGLWEVFGRKPDLLLRVRGDAMGHAGLADGAVVAVSLRHVTEQTEPATVGDIVAVKLGDEVVPRRVGNIDGTTLQLRPEGRSRKHRTVQVDSRADDVELVGVVTGRVLAGAG